MRGNYLRGESYARPSMVRRNGTYLPEVKKERGDSTSSEEKEGREIFAA